MLGTLRRPVAFQRDRIAAPDAAFGGNPVSRPAPVLRPVAASGAVVAAKPPRRGRLLRRLRDWLRSWSSRDPHPGGVAHLAEHMLRDIGLRSGEAGARPLPIRLPRQF